MKIAVVVMIGVVVVCGTMLVLAPLAYDVVQGAQLGRWLGEEKWVSMVTGIVMIVGAMLMLNHAMLHGHPVCRKDNPKPAEVP